MKYIGLQRLFILTVILLALAACNAVDRINEIGSQPKLASVQDPSRIAGITPVSMPMPAPTLAERQPNSLWQTGARAFFRDQRASRVGDILTVVISIDEKAQLQNNTKRTRENTDTASANSALGLESRLDNLLLKETNPASLLDTQSSLSNEGKGSVDRSEKINLRVAATITQILPNGNLVLAGKQQVAVNFDMRELQVTGVVRPEDISAENTVSYDQIAEARISYGGRGQLQDVQQPRYGSQLFDIIMPF